MLTLFRRFLFITFVLLVVNLIGLNRGWKMDKKERSAYNKAYREKNKEKLKEKADAKRLALYLRAYRDQKDTFNNYIN